MPRNGAIRAAFRATIGTLTVFLGTTAGIAKAGAVFGSPVWGPTPLGINHYITGSVFDPSGMLYVGTMAQSVYAVDTAHGYTSSVFPAVNPPVAQNWNIAPSIGSDGTVYWADVNKLYALPPAPWNAATTPKWQVPISSVAAIAVRWNVHPDGSDEVYMAGAGKLYAYNTGLANPLAAPDINGMSFPPGSGNLRSITIGGHGTLYVTDDASHLYALDSSGSLLWTYNIPTSHNVESGLAIGADGTIFFGSDDFQVYAISPSGQKKWSYQTLYHIWSEPAIGADGTVYVGGTPYVFAFAPNPPDPTNVTPVYTFCYGSCLFQAYYEFNSSLTIGADWNVYVGGNDGNLYALDAQLNYLDSTPLTPGSQVWSGPSFGPDGKTLYLTNYNYLTALPINTKSPGLATSAWPKWGHDEAHTRAGPVGCRASLVDSSCFHLKGSDTLFDVITTALGKACPASGASLFGACNLHYDGSGSGNAETQMTVGNATNLGVQSIGPMSRNFRPKVIDDPLVNPPGSNTYTQRDASHVTSAGHSAWAPTCLAGNVLGLDAAVVATKGSGVGSRCSNLIFGTFVNGSVPSAFKQANTNSNLTLAFGNGAAFNKDINSSTPPTVNYSNLLEVVLAGVDGSGSLAACSDPRRIQALQDLAGCMGPNHIEHIYRRDDNSGTTDTFKDRIMTVASTADLPHNPWTGGRFCNGQSIGGINGTTAQTGICSVTRTIKNCTADGVTAPNVCPTAKVCCPSGETCQYNMNNQDMDPIRRSCVAADSTHAPTSCTDMTAGKPCSADDGNPNCTQGLIVALSDKDPGPSTVTDVTTSIAARIANDASGQSMGYAGREAIRAGRGTKGFKLNGLLPSDTNVRGDIYLLSRRLYLMNAVNDNDWPGFTVDPATRPPPIPWDSPNDLAGPSIDITGGGEAQLEAEQSFFKYVTNHTVIDPILTQYGFIPCTTNPDNPCDPTKLCGKVPYAPAVAPLTAAVPNGARGGSDGSGGAKTINSVGLVWDPTTSSLIKPHCSSAGGCLTTGLACAANSDCDVYNNRPPNAACSQDTDCASGHCIDAFGFGAQGQGLICQ